MLTLEMIQDAKKKTGRRCKSNTFVRIRFYQP